VGRLPCELVIARSNEDILWSRNFANCTLTTVYNKARCSRSGWLRETASKLAVGAAAECRPGVAHVSPPQKHGVRR
jgi:hypothetical protein